MSLRRALPLVLVLAASPLQPATAQFGGMPGLPGSGGPGSPGGMQGGFGGPPPSAPPPACQQLLANRDETQKHANALRDAGQKKAPPEEACKLFKVFLASETKMIKGLEQHSSTCGVPGDVIKQLKGNHAAAEKQGKQVCDAAANAGKPTGPSLSDALGAPTLMPDASAPKRAGAGTFDTLSGNPLQR
jgi:hypothetical protein